MGTLDKVIGMFELGLIQGVSVRKELPAILERLGVYIQVLCYYGKVRTIDAKAIQHYCPNLKHLDIRETTPQAYAYLHKHVFPTLYTVRSEWKEWYKPIDTCPAVGCTIFSNVKHFIGSLHPGVVDVHLPSAYYPLPPHIRIHTLSLTSLDPEYAHRFFASAPDTLQTLRIADMNPANTIVLRDFIRRVKLKRLCFTVEDKRWSQNAYRRMIRMLVTQVPELQVPADYMLYTETIQKRLILYGYCPNPDICRYLTKL